MRRGEYRKIDFRVVARLAHELLGSERAETRLKVLVQSSSHYVLEGKTLGVVKQLAMRFKVFK